MSWICRDGRFFSEMDQTRAAHVVVLGSDTAEELFGMRAHWVKRVVVGGMLFTVVGVLAPQKQAFGGGKNANDNQAYFPITTFHGIHPEQLDYWITLKYDDAKNLPLVTERADRAAAAQAEGGEREAGQLRDLRYGYADAAVEQHYGRTVPAAVRTVERGAAGGGCVGVMNIMLVSVTERTREIGIRKAIGARKSTILTQFTLEAMTLCAVGGVIGVVVVGSVIATGLRLLLPSLLSVMWVSVAFLCSCGIGLLFGIYPAWKAASLNPIEALRYE